ncbi:MAG: SH3 domain-containing protein [Anaerolineae bacterium]
MPSSDPSRRTSGRGTPVTSLWPKWIWIAVPILVVIVVAGFWWAILSPGPAGSNTKTTPTPTLIRGNQPTQGPTLQPTLPPATTATKSTVPLATFTPTAGAASTPEVVASPTVAELAVGSKAKVGNTGGTGLNMRAGPSTGQTRVKTLAENSVVEIVGGPQTADNFVWYQVRDSSGTIGWVVGKFLLAQ